MEKASIKPISNDEIAKPKQAEIKKSPIAIPASFKLVKLDTTPTSFIGTIDQPTINGGVINTTDGLPVRQEPIYLEEHSTRPIEKRKPFEDGWAKTKEVKSVLVRAAREGKLDYVINESEKRGLPASVAIIPIVESKYNDLAISPKGAAGSWQIMPALANDYHIQDKDRFNFKKSTQVALNHIKQLYNQFGNLELVFAAYNAGSKRVTDALLKSPNAQSIDELALPLETKLYVKKIKSINQQLI